jgi:hypothetical protein
MPKQRYTRKWTSVDGNHDDLVGIFETLGGTWLELSNVAGALDGLLGVANIDQRVEFKNPDALRGKKQALSLTPAEQDEFDRWRGRPPVVVTTKEEAIELIHKLRKEACIIGKRMREAAPRD